MRTVGHRQPGSISFAASATLLAEGARFNDEIHRLPGGGSFIPKGVYHFRTHAEANRHQRECLARGMAALALARDKEIVDHSALERALAALNVPPETP
jgi:hypothetical protein